MLCGNSTGAEDVGRILAERKPNLMVTDPPYGIELDSEWRDRAGLNTAPGQKRTTASKAATGVISEYNAKEDGPLPLQTVIRVPGIDAVIGAGGLEQGHKHGAASDE